MGMRLTTMAALVALAGVIGVRHSGPSHAAGPQPGAGERKPAAKPAPPAEPPQYAGVIEQVKVYPSPAPAGRPVVQVLVRYTRPGRQPDRVWVHLGNATLDQRGAHLEAGSAASVWASGGVAKSDPPQVWAEYIVCEPARK